MADLSASYRLRIAQELQLRQRKNQSYSQASFAKFLGIDSTYLSKLLKGKILLSLDIADAICKRLKIDGDSRKEFLLSAAEEQRCHALYLIDPNLTECDPAKEVLNLQPIPRRKTSKVNTPHPPKK